MMAVAEGHDVESATDLNPGYPGIILHGSVTGSSPLPAHITSTSMKSKQPSLSRLSPNDGRSPRKKLDDQAKSPMLVPGYGSYNYGHDTSKNSSVVFCRICYQGESVGERLISPCRCSGSVGLIHRTCIEKWLTMVNNDTCEICKKKYSVSRHPRPFSSWLCEPVVGDDQRNLVGDGVCFILLTPLAVISAYLCASGAAFYFQQEKKSEAIGLICLSSLLVIIYMTWIVLTIRYHCQVWFKWRSNNQDIRLLNVSGQRISSSGLKQNRRSSLPHSPVLDEENVDAEEVDTEEAVVGVWNSLDVEVAKHALQSNSMSSVPSQDSLNTADMPADNSVLTETVDKKEVSDVGDAEPSFMPTPPPLSPFIFINPPPSLSKMEQNTEDDVIYEHISHPQKLSDDKGFPLDHQLSIHNRAESVPYLPDLKEHFIVLRSRQDTGAIKSAKTRGTFSPKNVTFSVTPVSTPTQPQPSGEGGEVSRAKPLPPPVPVRRS